MKLYVMNHPSARWPAEFSQLLRCEIHGESLIGRGETVVKYQTFRNMMYGGITEIMRLQCSIMWPLHKGRAEGKTLDKLNLGYLTR